MHQVCVVPLLCNIQAYWNKKRSNINKTLLCKDYTYIQYMQWSLDQRESSTLYAQTGYPGAKLDEHCKKIDENFLVCHRFEDE